MDDKTITDKTVLLSDVAKGETSIHGWTFTGCHIKGPIVVAFLDSKTTFEDCKMVGTQEQLLWEIAKSRRSIAGALGLIDCHFRQCTFSNVGFAGYPEVLEGIRESVNWGSSPN